MLIVVVRGIEVITVQFTNSETAFAKGTLLRYSATEWQAHRAGMSMILMMMMMMMSQAAGLEGAF